MNLSLSLYLYFSIKKYVCLDSIWAQKIVELVAKGTFRGPALWACPTGTNKALATCEGR